MKDRIGEYLTKFAQENNWDKYKPEYLDKCISYIISEARKLLNGKPGAIEDAVVYGWSTHFFDEELWKIEETTVPKPVIPVNSNYKPYVPPKPVYKLKAEDGSITEANEVPKEYVRNEDGTYSPLFFKPLAEMSIYDVMDRLKDTKQRPASATRKKVETNDEEEQLSLF